MSGHKSFAFHLPDQWPFFSFNIKQDLILLWESAVSSSVTLTANCIFHRVTVERFNLTFSLFMPVCLCWQVYSPSNTNEQCDGSWCRILMNYKASCWSSTGKNKQQNETEKNERREICSGDEMKWLWDVSSTSCDCTCCWYLSVIQWWNK